MSKIEERECEECGGMLAPVESGAVGLERWECPCKKSFRVRVIERLDYTKMTYEELRAHVEALRTARMQKVKGYRSAKSKGSVGKKEVPGRDLGGMEEI